MPDIKASESLSGRNARVRGRCRAFFAYDVGIAVDLAEAERLISAATRRDTIRDKRRAPAAVAAQPGPLRIALTGNVVDLGLTRSDPTVEAVLYDFGAVSVMYTLPIDTTLSELADLSDRLYEHPELQSSARALVTSLVETTAAAVRRPAISGASESYTIFEFSVPDSSSDLQEWSTAAAPAIAQVLRSSRAPLSRQEIADAMSSQISYSPHDLALIDWNAALLIGSDTTDTRHVLESANVELLEMRVLDQQLDDGLEESYRLLLKPRWLSTGVFGSRASDLQRIGRMQVDAAVLFEGVSNALKLVGDQYLARVYRLASQRFHLAEWDAAILRKIETLDSVYSKMSDRQINLRMEALEWIIIILIAIEVVMSLMKW